MSRFALVIAALVALISAACTRYQPPGMLGASAAMSSPWACAAPPATSGAPALYAMQSVWSAVQPKRGDAWGDDPAERGPVRLLRLDPATGATLAADAGPGVGFAAGADARLVARMRFRSPDPADSTAAPKFAGIELLAGDTLRPAAVLDPGPGLFPDRAVALRSATVALAADDHLLVVDGMGAGQVLSAYGPDWPQHRERLGALAIQATCLDRAQPAKPLARATLSDYGDGLAPCGTRPLVRPAADGSWFVLYALCAQYPARGALRLYRIDHRGTVTHVDLPFSEYEAPAAFSPDGARAFVADPRHQEIYSIETATGKVFWRQPYGDRPAPEREVKFIPAPNQLALSADGARLYLISNWQVAPSPGVWVIDARSGRVQAHLMADVGVTGLALAPSGDLYVASPQGGGRLWVLPQGDPARRRLLRQDLGDELSDILIGP